VIGAFYYLRMVKLMYFDAPEDSNPIAAGPDVRALISVNALALVAVMPWIGALVDLCTRAIQSLSAA
jgi:NADH-quinone oxidoreductase subunit N